MYRNRLAHTLAAAAVMATLIGSHTVCFANTRVYPPSIIMQGAAVQKSRAFYKDSPREDALAGIKLGRDAKEVLLVWGNPTRITLSTGTGVSADTNPVAPAGVTMPGMAPYGSPMGNPYAALATGLNNAVAEANGQPMNRGGLGGGLPGLPGYPSPGMVPPPMTPQPAQPSGTGLGDDEVTWSYDLSNGITLEFVLTDGIVTQITVGGEIPWNLSKTRSGLMLGDTYKMAIYVCGYPESQKYVAGNKFLRLSYANKNRVVYTFMEKRLVGVTIAIVQNDISLKN